VSPSITFYFLLGYVVLVFTSLPFYETRPCTYAGVMNGEDGRFALLGEFYDWHWFEFDGRYEIPFVRKAGV
jgi:hypothetical protein